MLKLLQNCELYAPAHIGKRDILILGSKIHKVEPDLSQWKDVPDIQVTDMQKATVCPGLIDLHVHVTGGGGEQGPVSRTPEIQLSDLVKNGVTAVLGLLGTDGISRSLENLLFKCSALEHYGITAKMLTGNYRYPSPTLTGDVARDIALIDPIIGVKVAVSDHRGSNVTGEELARLATEVRVSSMLAGKTGLVVMHMGPGEGRMAPLFWALEHSDVPPGVFLPTHCCRSAKLVAEAVRFNKMGGTVDFTADMPESKFGTAAMVCSALEQGADPARITMSSDGCGSQPVFDSNGSCIGITYTTPVILLHELRRFVELNGLPLSTALRFFTENPARVMGFSGTKGVIAPGADADIIALDSNYSVTHLMAKGKIFVSESKVVSKGYFEA